MRKRFFVMWFARVVHKFKGKDRLEKKWKLLKEVSFRRFKKNAAMLMRARKKREKMNAKALKHYRSVRLLSLIKAWSTITSTQITLQ